MILSRTKRLAALLGLLTLAAPAFATTPSADDGFTPSANAQVAASAIQSNGRIVAGGFFTTVQSPGDGGLFDRNRLVRLMPDGSVDPSFTAGVNGPVTAVLVQSDGKIVIGGYFTSLTDTSGTTVTRNHVARLDSNGNVDSTFDPNLSGPAPSLVYVATIAQDDNGDILIGGEFTTMSPNNATTPIDARRIARFHGDTGAPDLTFSPQFGNVVRSIAVQANGDIVVGGGFTTVASTGNTTSDTRKRIARLSSAGVVDQSFDPAADNLVTSVAIQLDGKVVVGGTFANLAPNGGDAVAHNRLARINSNGTLDASFRAGVNSSVESVKVTPDGKIIASGAFRAAVSTGSTVATRSDYIVRFYADGTIDTSFYPGPSYLVSTFSLQSDGKIFIGGSFTDFVPAAVGTQIPRRFMARLNEDGTLDASLNPSVNSQIRVMVEQADKSVLIGGSFGSIGGITRQGLARISATGAVDRDFDPGVVGTVYSIAIQPTDGKILVGGLFTNVIKKGTSETVAQNYIVRFNADGTLDTTFQPNPDGAISAIAVQSDGKILIGGLFSTLKPEGDTDSTSRVALARLNSDGTIDTAFTQGANNAVTSIEIEQDGHILIGGSFTVLSTGSTNSNSAPFIARLNSDGAFNSSFTPLPADIVTTVKVLSGGKIFIGGRFQSIRPTGSSTFTTRHGAAILNSDGTIDPNFDPAPNDEIDSIAIQDDGKYLVAGPFTQFYPNGTDTPVYRNYFARLNTDGTVDANYDPHPNLAVAVVLQQSGGGALISGAFNSFQPSGSTAVQLDTGLARILPDGSIDTAFRPTVAGTSDEIRSVSYQKDGSIYAGGSFTRLAGSFQNNLVHMRSEGIADYQFQASPDGPVNALLPRIGTEDPTTLKQKLGWFEPNGRLRSGLSLDSDLLIDGSVYAVARQTIGANAGKIIVAGSFTASTSTFSVSNLARFNANGSLDTTFDPAVVGTVFGVTVRSSDDALLITGSMTSVASTTRNGIALLGANGALVTGFDPNATGAVLVSAFMPDGSIIIGGQFTQLQPNGGTDTFTIRRLARLTAAGAVDTSFDPEPSAQVTALTIQPDQKILIGGLFATLQPNNASTATTRNGIARLNTDGTVDAAFDPNLNGGQATVIKLQDDGKIVIAGTFVTLTPNGATDSIAKIRIARLNTDGTVDTTMTASANLAPVAMEIQEDGAIVIAGEFTSVDGVVRNKIARISSTGELDPAFNPNAIGAVNALLLLPDQSIIAAGSFNSLNLNSVLLAGGEFLKVNDVDIPYLSLFTSDGNPLIGGVPVPNEAVNALVGYPDGRALLGGKFTQIDGDAQNHVARILENNSVDPDFSADISGDVNALALQGDGKVLVGGSFATAGGAAHANLARLDSTGTVDGTFTAATDGAVRAIAIQKDGKILVGGSFTILAGSARNGLGRLNADGSIDGTFTPVIAGGQVDSIAVQTDGGILIGGKFTSVGGSTRNYFAKIDGTTGAVDPQYDAQSNGEVKSIAVTPGGKVLVGGSFTNIGGLARYMLARLAPVSGVGTTLLAGSDGGSLLWQRTGSGPEVQFANFEISTNGRDWTSLGEGVRDNSIPGWKITGQALPQDSYFYARASSLVPTSQGSSASLIETVRAVYITSSGGGTDGSNDPPEIPARPSTFLAETYLSANPELANTLAGLPDRLDLAWVDYYTHKMSSDTEHLYLSGSGEASVDPKLTNLSARAWVGPGDQSLIMGVSISNAPVKLFVRALGPTLANYQIPNPLPDPKITVYKDNTVIASNDDWATDPSVTPAAVSEAGAAPMGNALDSAVVLTLQPGNYTFVIGSKGNTGVALGELFLFPGSTGSLSNLSARAQVGEGGDILIAGFIRQGVGELLLRGVGPDLAQYNITNYLADPVISLHKMSTGSTITTNDDWGQIANAISDKDARAGSVPFPQGSKDSAAYVVLGSGAYTLHVSGAQAGQKGVALVEVFELR